MRKYSFSGISTSVAVDLALDRVLGLILDFRKPHSAQGTFFPSAFLARPRPRDNHILKESLNSGRSPDGKVAKDEPTLSKEGLLAGAPSDPPVDEIGSAPTTEIDPRIQGGPAQAPAYLNYCDSAKAYFPKVTSCPEGWRFEPAR